MLEKILQMLDKGSNEDLLSDLYTRVRSFRIAKGGLGESIDAEIIWDEVVSTAKQVTAARIFTKAEMKSMLSEEHDRPVGLMEAINLLNEEDNEDDTELLRVKMVLAEAKAIEKYASDLDEEY